MERIKTMFDVFAPIAEIDEQLKKQLGSKFTYQDGLRVPGIWSSFVECICVMVNGIMGSRSLGSLHSISRQPEPEQPCDLLSKFGVIYRCD